MHHLFEKRFVKTLGINADDILSVVLDKDTHRQITKLMREKIPYDTLFKKGTSAASVQDIWNATRDTYKQLGMTEYLDELKQAIIDAGKASKITDWGKW